MAANLSEAAAPGSRPWRVLLVDHQAERRTRYEQALAAPAPGAWEIAVADRLIEAVTSLAAAARAGRPYDLVLLAAELPPGPQGEAPAATLCELAPGSLLLLLAAPDLPAPAAPGPGLCLLRPPAPADLLPLLQALAAARYCDMLLADQRRQTLAETNRRQQAEATLRANEASFCRFFAEDLTGVMRLDLQGHIGPCNEVFARMFGFAAPAQAAGWSWNEFFDNPQDCQTFWSELRRRGRLQNYQIAFRRGDGRELHAIGNYVTETDAAGSIRGVRVYLFDVTQHRDLERQFFQAQKLEAIGRFAGSMAHDFNNLLSVIRGYADLLLAELPPDTETHQFMAEIAAAGQRGSALSRQLLAFSRRHTLRAQVLEPRLALQQLQRLLSTLMGEEIEVRLDLADSAAGNVRIDPVQLEQILLNLATNARDAMPGGGQFRLQLRSETLAAPETNPHDQIPAGEYVVFAVSDTGSGMSAETLAQLLDPFYTTKPEGEGTGLGLATVYALIKQSNGGLRVRSQVGAGTTIECLLPRVHEEVEEVRPVLAPAASLRGCERILLVENDRAVCGLVARMLERAGYAVTAAAAGRAALALAPPPAGPWDLLLADVAMPGLDGIALATQLRQRWPQLHVVFMSGYPDIALPRVRAYTAPSRFVLKPFAAETLLKGLRASLDKLPDPDSLIPTDMLDEQP